MEEKAAKRRDKVKNAAIVFLTVLLILTFFSNTIMNYSLPEVSAQYVMSGEISSKVRGSGSVTASEPYSVTINEPRKVKKVYIHAGDKIKKGTKLFLLGKPDGQSISDAEDALDAAEYEYQQKLLSAYVSYAADNESIANLKADYKEAVRVQKEVKSHQEELLEAQEQVEEAQAEVDAITARISRAERELEAIDAEGDFASYQAAMERAEDNLALAKTTLSYRESELEAARNTYENLQSRCDKLEAEIAAEIAAGGTPDSKQEELLERLKKQANSSYSDWQSAISARSSASDVVTSCQAVYDQAAKDLERAKTRYADSVKAQKKSITAGLNEDKALLAEAEITLKQVTADHAALKEAYATTPESAKEAVKTAERALNSAVIALQDKKGTASAEDRQKALEIQNAAKKITKLEQKLYKLRTSQRDKTVTSKVKGVVSVVNVTAGDKATGETPLSVIEVEDRGYTVSFSVTNEQSRQVSVGIKGTVTNLWDSDVTAKLVRIQSDPDQPGTNKKLTFQVKGSDLTAGQILQISVGDKTANYESVVPSNAVRQDNKGYFILVVTAKSSPLGNRYIATRKEVEVLASDESNTAVSGGSLSSEYVITTSTKPIRAGMQVRMAGGES